MKKFLLLLLSLLFLFGIPKVYAQDVVTPTLYCLGSCPTEAVSETPTAPSVPTSPLNSPSEVSTTPIVSATPSASVTPTTPCTTDTAISAFSHNKKHKKKHGMISNIMKQFLQFLMQLLTSLLQLIGGTHQIPTSPNPCNPSPTQSLQTSPSPSVSTQPSTASPTGTTSVSPAPTTSGTTTSTLCKTIPSTPGVKPIATNTGVPSGITLTTNPPAGVQVSGDSWKVTSDGTIIDSKDIENKWVDIEAKNVTIKNSRIKAPDGVYWAVGNSNTTSGLKIYTSEIYTTNGAHNGMIVGSDSVVCGVNAHGFENIAVVEGTNIIMQSNYFHINKGAPGYADPHDDGMEVRAGSNIKILGNNIKQTNQDESWQHNTSALYVGATYGDIDKVVIDGNWFGGGTYSLYTVTVKGQKNPTPVLKTLDITNNKWYRNSYEYGPHSSDDGSSWKAHTWSNNTFEDNGQSIAF